MNEKSANRNAKVEGWNCNSSNNKRNHTKLNTDWFTIKVHKRMLPLYYYDSDKRIIWEKWNKRKCKMLWLRRNVEGMYCICRDYWKNIETQKGSQEGKNANKLFFRELSKEMNTCHGTRLKTSGNGFT